MTKPNDKMKGYEFFKIFEDFLDEHPEKLKLKHHSIFFLCVRLCNEVGWKEKFQLPTKHTMNRLNMTNKETYYNGLNDLVKWGLIDMIQKSKNQSTACYISLRTGLYEKYKIDRCKSVTSGVTGTVTDTVTDTVTSGVTSSVTSSVPIDKPLINFNKQVKRIKGKYTANAQKKNGAAIPKVLKPTKVFVPPTQNEVAAYFKTNGYSKVSAVKAFKFYDVADWIDSQGNPVRSWKQKMQGVWFKAENEDNAGKPPKMVI